MTIHTALPIVESSILIVGALGFIGRFLSLASVNSGRSTYILIRSTPTCPSKAKYLKTLEEKGALILHGLINDKEKIEKILKIYKIDIVISAVGGASILEQANLLDAIKAVGTIKRFLPSEFGHDVDRTDPVEPGLQMYRTKRKIRRLTENYGIPYTYICCNSIASWPYYDNTHPADVLPPFDQLQIYGDGTTKAYFVAGTDIGKFTMKIIDDVRTINKSVHFRPPSNLYNMNDLAALWEKKIGRILPRATITENDLLRAAAVKRIPESIVAALTHDIFIRGCQVNFSIDGPNEVEICNLYPEENFRSLEECYGEFATKLNVTKDENNAVVAAAPDHMVEQFIMTSCA
ncbi:leucoanthocyanidin reductase-like [Mercurialis annua]|uniref:leucoanthocyanidin reductase-like n=1 Tax=Mercurialis annua TaxID=3986 RepID=UPI00216028C8|nr:leucoanthocyanidin reductase-like [Mercurialis annua]